MLSMHFASFLQSSAFFARWASRSSQGSLKRRVRLRSLTRSQASAVRQRFLGDVAGAGWCVLDFEAEMFSRAGSLMIELGAPLATLDALHFACALHHGTQEFATADRQLATAAHKSKLRLRIF